LLLALYVALVGEVRAADVANLDDSPQLASADDDDFIIPSAGRTIAPPAQDLPVPLTRPNIGAGRTAVSDLFRPPQTAPA